MNQLQEDDIILGAALEFGADYIYEIKNGSLGTTLYVHASSREAARAIRADLPMKYEGIRTVVTYNCTNQHKEQKYMPV